MLSIEIHLHETPMRAAITPKKSFILVFLSAQ